MGMRRKSEEEVILEAEVLGYMPSGFVMAYLLLIKEALRIENVKKYDGVEKGKKQRRFGSGHDGGLKDEWALSARSAVNRELRFLTRELNGRSNKLGKTIACGCGEYVARTWKYCAWCGRMRVVGE